jgi:hypothetical protein
MYARNVGGPYAGALIDKGVPSLTYGSSTNSAINYFWKTTISPGGTASTTVDVLHAGQATLPVGIEFR